MINTIRILTDIPGTSGDEGRVRDAIMEMVSPYADTVQVDPLGNLIAFKKGKRTPKNRLLYCAHMDEVGFIVTFIEDSGLLRFAPVGGIDSRVVVGKAVEVGDNRLHGVIGTKAVHRQSDKEKEDVLPFDKLYIDIGAKDKEDAERHVSPGDRAVFYSGFREFGEGNILAKALDDRAGCALLIELMKSELDYDSYFAFTVQEETGCTGAVTAGYSVDADISVVVETTTASDIAGVGGDKQVCALGKGPVISFMDKGSVYDGELYRLALRAAKDAGIPTQPKAGVFGGNESRSLQVARDGARILAVSLPCRYIHSPSNMLRVPDIGYTRDLLLMLNSRMGDL